MKTSKHCWKLIYSVKLYRLLEGKVSFLLFHLFFLEMSANVKAIFVVWRNRVKQNNNSIFFIYSKSSTTFIYLYYPKPLWEIFFFKVVNELVVSIIHISFCNDLAVLFHKWIKNSLLLGVKVLFYSFNYFNFKIENPTSLSTNIFDICV